MSETDASEPITRRGFMRTATGAAAAAGAAGTAAAQEETTTGGGESGGGGGTTQGGGGGGGGGGGPTQEVVVGPGNSLVFEPAELTIAPGTTVHWVWESDNHNIVVESQPEGANWQGTEGDESTTYNTGHEYSFTFDTEGEYAYFCQPHQQAGMEATVTVQQGGGGGSTAPSIPSSAKTLGIATTAAMVFTLGLAYFFLRYGGDYGELNE